jgi:hypothetical protein
VNLHDLVTVIGPGSSPAEPLLYVRDGMSVHRFQIRYFQVPDKYDILPAITVLRGAKSLTELA